MLRACQRPYVPVSGIMQPWSEFLKQSAFSLRETELFTQFSSWLFPVVCTDMFSVVITIVLACLYLFRVQGKPATIFSFLCCKWKWTGNSMHHLGNGATGHGSQILLKQSSSEEVTPTLTLARLLSSP